MYDLILASSSPRRRDFLNNMGLTFTIVSPEIDESPFDGEKPYDLVARLAHNKAFAVFTNYPKNVVLAADTIVVCGNEILGKPQDRDDALKMILKLSGKTHQVYTAVCIVGPQGKEEFVTVTDVTFSSFDEKLARIYVDSGESDDKSGSYALQGIAAMLIEKVNGSVSSVVGLPACQTREALERFSIFPRTVKALM